MNGGRSDASTSTDDVKGRPLCLFYFTHPFAVLSPEPPTALGAAPAHIARAFLNMEPVSPFYWSGAADAAGDTGDSYRSTATGDSFELGAVTVHARPVSLFSVRAAQRGRAGAVPLPRCDSLSSSLFSSELWFESSCSSRAGCEPPARRLLPYNRILPPLRLPSARTLSECSEEDVWPRKSLHPEKFSLPPIELPPARDTAAAPSIGDGAGGVWEPAAREPAARRRRLGVDKQRRRRRAAATDVRRVLACLIRRAVAAGGCSECSPSPALARVLHTIRDAWAEPTTLRERCGIVRRTFERWMMEAPPPARLAEPPPPSAHAHASPGLLRRRYSVPETIMRKYRLAQQRSDSEESVSAARWSATSVCPSPAREATHSPCESPHRFLRRDRELMRKSALLRRMWVRPCAAPACCCCEEARATRSLDGSRSELSSRRSPAPRTGPWTDPKRHQLLPPAAAYLSDSTYQSHGVDRELCSCADTTDAFSDSESRLALSPGPSSSHRLSERVTAELERSPSERLPPESHCYPESETLSASVSMAKETSYSPPPESLSSNGRIEGRVSEHSAGVDNEDRNVPSYERPLILDTRAPVYELLEIVVSESSDVPADARDCNVPRATALALKHARDVDIDEYVSNILVESLNSLTDQLENMNASIGGHRRVSIVEKEIKVRLQNTGMNTIVHLSPTSNNQIIFGNEELCNEPRGARDECNNTLSIREERDHGIESNDNLTSSAGSPPSAPTPAAFEPPLQRDSVNRAVLHQIQQLFRDELRGLEEGSSPPPEAPPGVSLVEISNVDAYIEAQGAECAARSELEIATHTEGDIIAGVGTGNYFRDGGEAAAVPRFSAYPHTESMEVNTSSSESEPVCSECTSLVDSLDDPNSPRVTSLRRRVDLARSAIDVLELLPERASADSRGEAFFVRIEDDDLQCHEPDPLEGNVTVAEFMPEKIKQRLYRRHRKRELRMECARRSKVKQLKKELEQRRLDEAAAARRELERDCMTIVTALIDDVVAKIARDEYEAMRIKRRTGRLPAARSEENLARRARRRDLDDRQDGGNLKRSGSRRSSNKENLKFERHHIHGKLLARPSLTSPDRPPRRVYQKSEIHEGEKCIEILEILEYVNCSQSSPETTNSDENHNHNPKCKKSRIPIPVYERIQRTYEGKESMRLTGGDGRRASPPAGGRALAGALLQVLTDPSAAVTTAAPPEPRSRCNSLRFKRVFDMIPEERSSLSFESSTEDAEFARRASAPEVSTATPQPAPAPTPVHSPCRVTSTRSAGTSPPEERVRVLRSQTTMTSPCSKSAATSPLRATAGHVSPARAAPPRLAREGKGTEKRLQADKQPQLALVESAAEPAAPARTVTTEERRWSERRVPPASRGEEARDRRRASVTGAAEQRRAGGSSSSDSGDSGGSLLCSLAPRWLSSNARQRRRARRQPLLAPPTAQHAATHAAQHAGTHEDDTQMRPRAHAPPPAARDSEADEAGSGGWSVTVAGSCRAALPADVEMRLRFPGDLGAPPAARRAASEARRAAPHALSAVSSQECRCVQCARCAGAHAALPPAPALPSPLDPRLTLTMKKEAQDSSILASKSVRKSSEQLPELETYRASRTKTKSSVKAVVSDAAGVLPALLAARRRVRAYQGQ